MSSNKKTYKMIHDTGEITGTPTEVSVDNLFQYKRLYMIMGTGIYSGNTASWWGFNYRNNGANNTATNNNRTTQLAQHGQSALVRQAGEQVFPSLFMSYSGTSAITSMSFRAILNTGDYNLESAYVEAQGHVNGTGYRHEYNGVDKIEILRMDGFRFYGGAGQNIGGGRIRVFEIISEEGKYLS